MPLTNAQLLRSPSLLLLGFCLMFMAWPSVRVIGNISFSDVFFVLSLVVGLVERIWKRELNLSPRALNALLMYILATLLFLPGYLWWQFATPVPVAGFDGRISDVSGVNLTLNANVLFGGGSTSQTKLFLIFLINTSLMPVALWIVRIKRESEWVFLWRMWTFGAVYGALVVVLNCNGLWPFELFDRSWVYIRRASGLTAHANILAAICMLAIPGLLIAFTQSQSWLQRAFFVVCFCLVWGALDLTKSRSGVVGVFVIVGGFWVLSAPQLGKSILRFVSGTVIASSFLIINSFSGGHVGGALGRLLKGSSQSDGAREIINGLVWEQALNSPFVGVGYSALKVAHNLYLQMWHVAGVFGLVGYLIVILMPIFLIWPWRKVCEYRNVSVVLSLTLWASALLALTKSNPGEFTLGVFFALVVYWGLSARYGREFSMPLQDRTAFERETVSLR
ncbi:MAG: O-antigen ligase family protein [Oceanococcus sp.]